MPCVFFATLTLISLTRLLTMNALAQFLIDQLTDFQTLTPTGQVAWLIGILGVLSAPFVWLRYWAKAKDSGYAKISPPPN